MTWSPLGFAATNDMLPHSEDMPARFAVTSTHGPSWGESAAGAAVVPGVEVSASAGETVVAAAGTLSNTTGGPVLPPHAEVARSAAAATTTAAVGLTRATREPRRYTCPPFTGISVPRAPARRGSSGVHQLLIEALEPPADGLPGVALLGQPPRSGSEVIRERSVGQHLLHRRRELTRLIGEQQMRSVDDVDALGAQAGRNDRLGLRHGLDDLQSRTASEAKWNDDHGGALDERPDIVDHSEDLHGVTHPREHL